MATCRKRLECALAFNVVPSRPNVRLAAAPRRPSASVVAKKRTLSVLGRVRNCRHPLRVVCANPRRVAKVQQQMRREISNMLQTDKV